MGIKTIEQIVVTSMDGTDEELFPFLPYITQDLWEIGADPDTITKLMRKHSQNHTLLKVLDLGCGKGAVSVKLAAELNCSCFGIDGVPEFIEYARQKANEHKVDHLCRFEIGDIRERVKDLSGYDILILGAIGPVFGDYYSTLTLLSKCLSDKGIFIIDDAYIDDMSDFSHPLILKKSIMVQQIDKAGMRLIEDDIMGKEDIMNSESMMFGKLERRCLELVKRYPEKQDLLLNYIKSQQREAGVLENKAVVTTMVITRKLEQQVPDRTASTNEAFRP